MVRILSLTQDRSYYNKNIKPIVSITFDDGYEGDYLNSFPVLKQNGICGTFQSQYLN